MNKMMQTEDRRDESNDMQLKLVETKPDPSADAARNMIGIEATLLDLDDGAFARLTSAVWCGGGSNGGMSGFDDSRRHFICPAYGQF